MKIGDSIYTPRFCTVKVKDMFDTQAAAYAAGYYEPTYYDNPDYEIQGKHTGLNRMVFAAVRKGGKLG